MNWSYIRKVFLALGFSSKPCDLINNCFSPLSYPLLLNGCSIRKFTSSNGLCKGEPLSPCLF